MLCGFHESEIRAQAPTNEATGLPCYEGPGPWFTCDPKGEMMPRLAPQGIASTDGVACTTLPKLLLAAAKAKGDRPAMKVERPCPELEGNKAPPALPEEDWTTWTYAQYAADARAAAKGFVAVGVEQFDSINVWGFNSPEWMLSAYGAVFAGGKVAGIYPTDTPDTAAYKVLHSGGVVTVVEDRTKLKKLVQGLEDAPQKCTKLKAFVAYGFEPAEGETVEVKGVGAVPVHSWATLLELGSKIDDSEIDGRIAATKPGHCAALIYTSGTTGMPKAVMISHDNIVWESTGVGELLKKSCGFGATAAQERGLSYLPLSHVAGMMLDIVCPVVMTAVSEGFQTIYFARVYDLKAGTLKDRLQVCKPTVFLGVPLVWEKIADRIRAIGAETTGVKKMIATWAKEKGLAYAKNCQLGGSGSKPFGYGLADSLVLSKIKANLGLQELKFGMTGAAPIRVDTLEYFGQLGIEINEVYGMSECCGASTFSMHQAHVWGSCGFELPGIELKIFRVDEQDLNKKTECPRAPSVSAGEEFQGEICWRSRGNMMGYMANPDFGEEHVKEMEKKTAEAIDAEGWLHSGDKGLCTVDGMVKITGRYKELIIGEGGENIAPVPIEDHVKKSCDGICEIMMVGDKRKYNVALVTLKAVGANGEVPGTDTLDAGAARVKKEVTTISQAMEDKDWIEAVTAAITSANSNNKVCVNNSFKIQKFTILPTNFSEEGNELTPTKKLKRKVVEGKYAEIIEKLYSASEKGPYVHY